MDSIISKTKYLFMMQTCYVVQNFQLRRSRQDLKQTLEIHLIFNTDNFNWLNTHNSPCQEKHEFYFRIYY